MKHPEQVHNIRSVHSCNSTWVKSDSKQQCIQSAAAPAHCCSNLGENKVYTQQDDERSTRFIRAEQWVIRTFWIYNIEHGRSSSLTCSVIWGGHSTQWPRVGYLDDTYDHSNRTCVEPLLDWSLSPNKLVTISNISLHNIKVSLQPVLNNMLLIDGIYCLYTHFSLRWGQSHTLTSTCQSS